MTILWNVSRCQAWPTDSCYARRPPLSDVTEPFDCGLGALDLRSAAAEPPLDLMHIRGEHTQVSTPGLSTRLLLGVDSYVSRRRSRASAGRSPTASCPRA